MTVMNEIAIPAPETVAETGLSRTLLEGLALKILYLEGELTLVDLAQRMRLAYSIIEELFERLRKEHLCEVKGMDVGVHRIATTDRGRTEAADLLTRSHYAGPAPICLKGYVEQVHAQTVRDTEVHPSEVTKAFSNVVLSPEILSQLGTAIVSGRSIFLYGPTGTGKTLIAETIPSVYEDSVWLPYAVEVDGQVIVVYDSDVHEPLENTAPESDPRWVLCRRPRIMAGGELTVEMLDLQYNPLARFYAAPLQMKANNGVLILDDFGRQRAQPEELLNRWIVPLERRTDFLSLLGGKKFEIPFDLFVVFATNLDPSSLADEAFLRRIQTKVRIGYTTRQQFHEIFRRVCAKARLSYDASAVDFLIDMLKEMDHPLRACYPRDFVDQICWRARYEDQPPELGREALLQACRNYFVAPPIDKDK